jgi:hypothetical protein
MECLLQYLDNLDDLFGALGLLWETMRRAILMLLAATMVLVASGTGIWLALLHPPAAAAISTVLFVILLYRSVTSPALKSLA